MTAVGDGLGATEADGLDEIDGSSDGPGSPVEGEGAVGGGSVAPGSPLVTGDADGAAALGVGAIDGRPATPRSVGGFPNPTARANVAKTRFRTPRAMTRR